MPEVKLVPGVIKQLLEQQNWPEVYSIYIDFLRLNTALLPCYIANLALIKQRFSTNTIAENTPIGVFCWNTANNALGRAVTLADCYRAAGFDIKLLGCVPYPRWRKVWQPLAHIDTDIDRYELASHNQLLALSCDFVLQHPLRYVHISKPRLPGVVVGLLYKLLWGAAVVIDVDDEEMAFFANYKATSSSGTEVDLADPYWTKLAISLIPAFDAVTVSNPALQQRYGGIEVPHARDAMVFSAKNFNKQTQRQALGIPDDKKVILFMGTPREHKGVLETAKALAELELDNYVYVIVGSFIDKTLEKKLLAIDNLNVLLLPNQSYDKTAETVVVADLCVLLQDTHSEAAQFQLPAKLIDAVAMGVPVMLETTAATQYFVDNKLVLAVNRQNLAENLKDFLTEKLVFPEQQRVRHYFEQKLSVQAAQTLLSEVVEKTAGQTRVLPWREELMQHLVANDLEAFLATCQSMLQADTALGSISC